MTDELASGRRGATSRGRLAGLVLAIALVASACGAGAEPDAEAEADAAVRVVVTTAVLGDLAGQVLAEEDVAIDVLIEPGVDPHVYAPSARDAQRLAAADLVIANGLGLEVALDGAIDGAAAEGVPVLRVAERADPLPFAGDVGHAEEEADDGHEDEHEDGLDPHVWLDPIRVATMATAIGERYAELVPERATQVTAAATAVADRFTALADELTTLLDAIPDDARAIVTNHDALGYFAARFDLEVVATVLPGATTQAAPGAGEVAELVALLEREGVRVVFTEATAADGVARSLAADAGDIAVVELYTGSLGEPGSGADTLEGLLRTDAQLLVDALS